MKRLLLLTIALFLLFSPPALAVDLSAGDIRVFDQAGLFTAGETQALEEKISQLRAEWDMDFVVLTTDDAQGQTARDYGDGFYAEHHFGVGKDYSGLLILIDMDNREMHITTSGDMIYYLTDERIESVLDIAYPYLTEGDYANAAYAYLGGTEQYLQAGIPKGQYTYDEETGEIVRYRSLTPLEAGISLAAAAAVSLLRRQRVVSGARLKPHPYAYNAAANSHFAFLDQQDVFLRTDQRRIPLNTGPRGGSGGRGGLGSGSGRSTIHHTGGRSFGGGGRKF